MSREKYYAQSIVRTWTQTIPPKRNRAPKHDEIDYGAAENPLGTWHYNLTFDTETTTDERQRLRFGVFILDKEDSRGQPLTFDLEKNGPEFSEVTGVIWEDELPSIDPDGHAAILAYAEAHGYLAMSRHEFVQRILYPYGFRQPCQILGYNLPFDISRVAIRATYAKRDPDMFTFRLSESPDGNEHSGRAGIQVKKLGSHKSLIKWTKAYEAATKKVLVSKSVFIDLSQAANAYSGLANPLSLGDAGLRYGCTLRKTSADYSGAVTAEYLDYCVNDVRLTRELYGRIAEQHRTFSPGLPLHKVYSTASLAKHLLKRMGIKPPLQMNFDVDPAFLGHCEAAFYGARTEAHALGIWPGIMNDFTSMYPTCGSLMNISSFLTAQKIEVQDRTDQIRELLNRLDTETCFDRALWPKLTGVARLVPSGDILPFRARFGEQTTSNIAVTPVTSDQEYDYFLPDVVASAVLTGKAPQIKEAKVIVPVGKQLALKTAKLPGGITLDPRKDDIFRTLVEQRANYKQAHCKGHPSEPDCIKRNQCEHCANSLFLKILANSLYGIFAELNRVYAISGQTVQCFSVDYGTWTYQTQTPEMPGTWCFPPLAGLFTSGARLMLAMLERLVTDQGGTYATTDTDSMFIVSTPDGRTLADGTKTLTLDQVAEIRERFESVSPYSKAGRIRLLKQEGDYCYSAPVSSKRYCLLYVNGQDTGDVPAMVNDGDLRVGKRSDHGLGYLMSPLALSESKTGRSWKAESWDWLVRLRCGLPVDEYPEWFTYPAVMQHTISTPHLHKAFREYNRGKSYQDQVKPFNFCIVAVGSAGFGDSKPSCIAPYTRNVNEALFMDWTDIKTGRIHRLGVRTGNRIFTAEQTYTLGECPSIVILSKSYGDILDSYAAHAERKAAGADGKPSGRYAAGVLGRLNIVATGEALPIGKETNYADERNVGLRTESESVNVYSQDYEIRDALVVLRQLKSADVARQVHSITPDKLTISDREVRYVLAGKRRPGKAFGRALIAVASHHARLATSYLSFDTERARLRWYAENIPEKSMHHCAREGCNNAVSTRQKYCSPACRQSGYRTSKKVAA